MDTEREEIVRYAEEIYLKRGKLPSVREIQTKFKISARKFYKFFPNGVRELHELARVRANDSANSVSEELKRKIISKMQNIDLVHEINEIMYKLLKLYFSLPNDPQLFSEVSTGLEICQDFKRLISEGSNVEDVRRLWKACSKTLNKIVRTLEERWIWERALEIKAQKIADKLLNRMISQEIILK